MDDINFQRLKEYCHKLLESMGDKQLWTKDTTRLYKPLDADNYTDAFLNSLNLYYEFAATSTGKIATPYYVNARTGLTVPLLPEIESAINSINRELRIKSNDKMGFANAITGQLINLMESMVTPDKDSRLYQEPFDPTLYVTGALPPPKPRLLRPAPSHWIRFANGIFDLKTKILTPEDQVEDAGTYNYLKGFPFDYLPHDKRNPLHMQLLERITLDWGDGKEENQNFIKQIVSSVIEGKNKGVCIILKSDGGGGKSTFISMLQSVVNLATANTRGAVIQCGLFELNDDHKLGMLSEETLLIVGDEAPTDAKLSAEALARVKNIADDNSAKSVGFMINVKFGPARTVKSRALILQNTNSNVNLFESTAAVKDRVLLFPWTNRNFRTTAPEDLNIGVAINNPDEQKSREFYQNFISWIIETTPYFTSFSKPGDLVDETNRLLMPSGAVPEFFKYIDNLGLLDTSHVYVHLLFDIFKVWCQKNYPVSFRKNITNFSQEAVQYLTGMGFIRKKGDKNDEVYISKQDHTAEHLTAINKALGLSGKELLKFSNTDIVMFKRDNRIQKKDIEAFIEKPATPDVMNSVRTLTMYYIALRGSTKLGLAPHPELIDKYGDIIN